MIYSTLIEAGTLNAHLSDPDWVVVDCRFNLMDTEAGRRAYREAHIPGARYAHLDEDLSGPINPHSGRHPLPDPQRLAGTLGGWGIAAQTQVVAYDDGNGALAARLWWLLRWLGSERCAVLDGGIAAWRERGLPLSTAIPTPTPVIFKGRADQDLWVDTAAVLSNIDSGENLLIDARAAIRYRGEKEPIDPVAGHVPGAVNLPLEDNVHDGRFLPPDELRQRFSAMLDGRSPSAIVHMCGSGVSACQNMLAMEVAGLSGSRLYPGSWSEWIRDSARPIATGPKP